MQQTKRSSQDSNISQNKSNPQSKNKYKRRSFLRLIINEENSFQQKGYGLVVSALIAMFFMFVLPYIGKTYLYPTFMNLKKSQGWADWQVFIFFTLLIQYSLVIVFNSMYVIIYKLNLPFFEQYKVNSELWPWQEQSEEKKKEWKLLKWKLIRNIPYIYFVILPPIYILGAYNNKWESLFRMELESFPGPKEICIQLLFCTICEDLSFHLIHKIMHLKYIYPYVHKKHHEVRLNVAAAYIYQSGLDFVISGVFPSTIGQLILGGRMHYFTYLMWITLRITETMDGHCGYEFPWSPYRLIPFAASTTYHDFHHSKNVGNYSSFFTFWDTVFGDNRVFYEYQERLKNEKLIIKSKQN
eukprot:403347100